MSTQYDNIHTPYYKIRHSSIAFIERANVKDAAAPYIMGSNVLDLACGAGFYSYEFLGWGAIKVTGVDISAKQIELARTTTSQIYLNCHYNQQNLISFHVADCSIPQLDPKGPFDLVHGAWLINYAPNLTVLTNMFRNIALNLKPNGTFIGVLKPPTQDPEVFINIERKLRPLPAESGGLLCTVWEVVEDGVKLSVRAGGKVGRKWSLSVFT